MVCLDLSLMKTVKLALFVSGDRGVFVLEKLLQESLNVEIVIAPTVIHKKYLEKINFFKEIGKFEIVLCGNPNDSEIIKKLELTGADLYIVAGYPVIFKEELLNIPKFGCLNLHAGPLPKYRGGSPLNWQIINGEKRLGLSIIILDSQIDNGPVVVESALELADKISIVEAHAWANSKFPQMTIEAISLVLERGRNSFRAQDESEAIYWHQRNDGDGKISFATSTVKEVDCMVRALGHPYGGAWALYDNNIVRIYEVQIPNILIRGIPGRICFIQSKGPYVVCKDGAVLLLNYIVTGNIQIKHGFRFS